jgi:hypothetical protein
MYFGGSAQTERSLDVNGAVIAKTLRELLLQSRSTPVRWCVPTQEVHPAGGNYRRKG